MGFRNPITSLSGDQITPGTLNPGVIAQSLADGTVIASKVAASVLSSNLLRNPGFEDTGEAFPTPGTRTSVPGWTLTGTAGQNFRWGNDQFSPASGNGYALLGWASSAWQTVPAMPGYQYRAAAKVKLAFGNPGNALLVALYWSFDGGATWPGVVYNIGTATNSYTEVSVTSGTIPAGVTHLRFEARGYGGGALSDFVLIDSCVLIRLGSPAVEITPAGLRMWNKFGSETITLNGESAVIGAGVLIAGAGAQVYGDLNVTGNTVLSGGVHTYVVNSDTTLVAGAAPVTTSGANTFLSGTGEIQRVSSLRRYKLDREVIPAAYELLDVEPVTWHDAAAVAADPSTTVRVAGFVAENVQDISAAAGGALDPLLVLDESGALAGLSYDRFVAYLLPIISDVHRRVLRLETP